MDNRITFIFFFFFIFTACQDSKVGLLTIDQEFTPYLKGEVAPGQSLVLSPLPDGKPYILSGYFRVRQGAVLTIMPGTTIQAQGSDTNLSLIVVDQGGVLCVKGTAESPVVFTCEQEERGAWGGIVIKGFAPVNSDGIPRIDLDLGQYGGNVPTDSSGCLQYVVVEYAGFRASNIAELNGITLLGVGNGTKIDNIFVRESGDDGVEMFGGTVDLTHILVKNCTDDLFDWTEGWQGKGQFWIGHFCNPDLVNTLDSRGIEAQSFNFDPGVVTLNWSRQSIPKIYNLSLIGDPQNEDKAAIQVKSGELKLYNIVILDYDLGLFQLDTCTQPGGIEFKGLIYYDAKTTNPPLFLHNCDLAIDVYGKHLINTYPLTDLTDCSMPNYRLLSTYSAPPFNATIVDPKIEEPIGSDRDFFQQVLQYGGDDSKNWAAWTNKFN